MRESMYCLCFSIPVCKPSVSLKCPPLLVLPTPDVIPPVVPTPIDPIPVPDPGCDPVLIDPDSPPTRPTGEWVSYVKKNSNGVFVGHYSRYSDFNRWGNYVKFVDRFGNIYKWIAFDTEVMASGILGVLLSLINRDSVFSYRVNGIDYNIRHYKG